MNIEAWLWSTWEWLKAWLAGNSMRLFDVCRVMDEWTTKLMNDDSFTDPIPSNQADFVALVTARSDYQNRKARDDANKQPK